MKPRVLRELSDEDTYADALADYCALLIDALQIPEVVDALTDAIEARQRPADPPVPARPVTPPSRGRRGR